MRLTEDQQKIVVQWRPLAYREAYGAKHLPLPLDDRISAALEGLCIGVLRHDPAREPFAAYLIKVIRSRILKAAHTESRTVSVPSSCQCESGRTRMSAETVKAADRSLSSEHSGDGSLLASHGPGPCQIAEEKEETERLYAAIAKLSPIHREATIDRLAGLSVAQSAESRGVCANTMSSRRDTAVRQLKEILRGKS